MSEHWKPKIETNQERDKMVLTRLVDAGWASMVVWQCDLRDLEGSEQRVKAFLRP